jgi:hypothetical protein
MRRSSKKLPTDANQLAAAIVRMSTEEPDAKPTDDRSPILAYLAEIGRKGGLKGGKARAKVLSATQRKEIAMKAAKTRWAKRKH